VLATAGQDAAAALVPCKKLLLLAEAKRDVNMGAPVQDAGRGGRSDRQVVRWALWSCPARCYSKGLSAV